MVCGCVWCGMCLQLFSYFFFTWAFDSPEVCICCRNPRSLGVLRTYAMGTWDTNHLLKPDNKLHVLLLVYHQKQNQRPSREKRALGLGETVPVHIESGGDTHQFPVQRRSSWCVALACRAVPTNIVATRTAQWSIGQFKQ